MSFIHQVLTTPIRVKLKRIRGKRLLEIYIIDTRGLFPLIVSFVYTYIERGEEKGRMEWEDGPAS